MAAFLYADRMEGLRHFILHFEASRLLVPFIPLFVAFDVLGILPIFVSMTAEISRAERRAVVRQATVTSFLASIGFLIAGK